MTLDKKSKWNYNTVPVLRQIGHVVFADIFLNRLISLLRLFRSRHEHICPEHSSASPTWGCFEPTEMEGPQLLTPERVEFCWDQSQQICDDSLARWFRWT